MKNNSHFFEIDKVKMMDWKKTTLSFGMYKDFTIQKIWEMDAQYLRWLLDNTQTLHLRKFEEDRIREKAEMEEEGQTKADEKMARRFYDLDDIRGE